MSTNHQPPCVITIGNFDGVHKGHSALINTAVSFAHDTEYRQQFLNTHTEFASSYASLSNISHTILEKMEARIITFSPHPAYVLNSKNFTPLMDDETRLFFLQGLGADHIDTLTFHQTLAKQSCEDFCVKMVQDYNMKILFIGYDFKMGCDQGSNQLLEAFGKTYGFCVQTLPPVSIEISHSDKLSMEKPSTDKLIISSTHIRKALKSGNMELATRMLGKYFHIKGIVEHGAKRGADLLGFPTANLSKNAIIAPKNGVYTTLCKILIPKYKDMTFLGVTNIGHSPTFGEFTKSVETHILDFNDDLYELPMEISFIHFIRDEIKFNSLEELIKQIKADINVSRKIFAKL